MAAPKLDQVIRLMESGEPFSLPDSQYKRKTGQNIPKNLWYLLNRSAIAKKRRSMDIVSALGNEN